MAAYVSYYQELGRLVTEMSQYKRTMDTIRLKNTKVPPKDWAKVCRTATDKHDDTMRQFMDTLGKSPKSRTKR